MATVAEDKAENLRKIPSKIFSLRRLRISLKYRPDILKLIMKMRHRIKKNGAGIKKLKYELKKMECKEKVDKTTQTCLETRESSINTELYQDTNTVETSELDHHIFETESKPVRTDSSTQTEDVSSETTEPKPMWNMGKENGEEVKSIAEQVKEAAQSAIQQTGMVYVESAGMYYDYKTGYYYNSELGLYYHTDTGCYYHYSDEKKAFQFHSYPDRNALAANAKLVAHVKRKARKHKPEQSKEDDIENLTKNLSQDKEERTDQVSKRKRRKTSKKVTGENKPSEIGNEVGNAEANPKAEGENIRTEVGNAKKAVEISKTAVGNDKSDVETVDTEVEKAKIEVKTKTDDAPEKENPGEEKDVKSPKGELEDGECSDTDSEHSDDDVSGASTSSASDDDTIARHHPPCMRVIVRETQLPKLKVGTLFLITKDGGSVGREGDQHTILLRDHNVSRNHLDIRFDEDQRIYVATDLGSKNGTILNGSRMSESQIISPPVHVMHGSVLQLGETKLLCHIHPGNDTCGHCEPGLLMETEEKEKVAYTRTCNIQKQHQLELARLKNKYAPPMLSIEATAYNDRAQARRDTVGSTHHSEKTQTADLDTCIASENKGFKLLEKMGWSKGEGLGRDSQGDTEPVPLISNDGKAGLGTPSTGIPSFTPKPRNTLGSAMLRLAAKTKMLQPPAKAFQQPDEDSE